MTTILVTGANRRIGLESIRQYAGESETVYRLAWRCAATAGRFFDDQGKEIA
jgi:NAD(P)-dependent dehydrogenase (short-subunit alcohol dehydrogenase family)